MDPRAQWIDYNNHKKLYMRGWGEKGRERKCVCMCLRMSVSECVCEREREQTMVGFVRLKLKILIKIVIISDMKYKWLQNQGVESHLNPILNILRLKLKDILSLYGINLDNFEWALFNWHSIQSPV